MPSCNGTGTRPRWRQLGHGARTTGLLALTLLLVQCAAVKPHEERHAQGRNDEIRGRVVGVRVPFVANEGQTDPAVAYYASTFSGTVFVTREGQIIYSLPLRKESASGVREPDSGGWALAETAVDGRARPSAGDSAGTRVSYFRGRDRASWMTGVATFETLSLGEVWPGIVLDVRASGKAVEKVFTVRPGADWATAWGRLPKRPQQ